MTKKQAAVPVKVRRRYRLEDGTVVPGVTAVTGLRSKPSLVRWANKLGLEGIDASCVTEQSARIGTLAHAMIRASLLGEPFDMENADPAELSQAEEAFRCFLRWRERHSLRPVHCERSSVSEVLRYGGTPDCYCILDGEPVLLDFKTGKRIYDEYFVQLAAYARLLREQGYPVRELRVLRLGRAEEDCEERGVTEQEGWFRLFENLLNIYYLRKDLGWRS